MRRIRQWVTMSAVLTVAAALVLGIGWLGRTAAPPGEIEALVAAAEQRFAAQASSREVAWGEACDGAAFAHYDAAKRMAGPLVRAYWNSELRVPMREKRPLSPAELDAWRSAWTPVLERFQQGSRCRDGRRRADSKRDWIPLLIAANLEVHLRLREQRWIDAVCLWLDLGTYLLDIDESRNLTETWSDDVLATLPPEALQLLDCGLSVLDRRLATSSDYAAANAIHARRLLDADAPMVAWTWDDYRDAWDWGFDPTRRHLTTFAMTCALSDGLPPAAPTGIARQRRWEELERRAPGTGNPLVAVYVLFGRERDREDCRASSQLRTLRLGIAAHLGIPPPGLSDPWTGEPFRIDREDGAIVVHPATPNAKPVRWTAT